MFQWEGSAWYLYSYPLREMLTSPWTDQKFKETPMLCATNKTTHAFNSILFLPTCIIFLTWTMLGKGLGPNQRNYLVLQNKATLQGESQHVVSFYHSSAVRVLSVSCALFCLSNYAYVSLWFSAAIAKDLWISFGYNLLFYFSLQVFFFFQPQRKPKLGKAGLLSLFSNSPEGKSWYQSHKKMILFFSCSKENPSL